MDQSGALLFIGCGHLSLRCGAVCGKVDIRTNWDSVREEETENGCWGGRQSPQVLWVRSCSDTRRIRLRQKKKRAFFYLNTLGVYGGKMGFLYFQKVF